MMSKIDESLFDEPVNHYGHLEEISKDDVFVESEYLRLIDPHGIELWRGSHAGDTASEGEGGPVGPLAPLSRDPAD